MRRVACFRMLWMALAVLVALPVAQGLATASATAANYAYDAPSQDVLATPVGQARSADDGSAAGRPSRDSSGDPSRPSVVRLTQLARDYVTASGVGKQGACHLFRHTMATLMLEGGADIRYI